MFNTLQYFNCFPIKNVFKTQQFFTMSFKNKVALITGASSGIGAATAISFSKEGANVVLVGRNETKLNNTASECDGNPLIIIADITNGEDAKKIISDSIKTFGKIDILVNNAGIVRYESILDESVLETFDEVINTNLRAVVNITRLAVPLLIESKGNIVNISSISGKTILNEKLVAYSMSKAALDSFTKSMALKLASYGVRVNEVSPGLIRTDILKNCGDETPWESYNEMMPLGKIGEPEEIANMVLYLASDKAKSITGADFVVDNGMLLK